MGCRRPRVPAERPRAAQGPVSFKSLAPLLPAPAPVELGAPRNLLRNIPTGDCRYDACVGTAQQPGQCAITTPNARGGHREGINGIRICRATSSSTVGWGGEPDRAVDQRSVRGALLPCRAVVLSPCRDSPYE